MYYIKYFDDYIHIPGDDEFCTLDPVLDREVNKAGKLTFSILDTHPHFGELEKLKFGIIVKDDNKTIFKGRVVTSDQEFDNEYAVTIEGKLAALNDSPCRPYEFAGNPEELFDWFLENHNAQVSEPQRFKKGRVTVTDSNDYIARSWDKTEKTWSLIKSRLLDPLGGFLVVRYEEDGDYLDWVKEFPNYSTQDIEFGENLLDLEMFIDASETYTACIPYGAEIEDESDTKQLLTIESVNDGRDYLINEQMAERYGVIYAPTDLVTWEDVTRPENLLTKATSWLNNEGITFGTTVDVSFVDLSKMGVAVDAIDMYQNVLIKSTPHNIEVSYLVGKMRLPLDAPEELNITLGITGRTFTDRTLGERRTDGKPGDNGKSAYEIWLEAGNSGTEEEYLESLKGEAGTSVKSMTRYYLLQDSSLEAPEKPTEYPPSSMWETTEPEYDADSDSSLYRVECTLYSDGTWQYTDVSLSSDYESVKSVNEKIDSIDAALHEEIIEQSSYILRTGKEITMGILAGYTTVSDLKTYKKQIENLFSTSEEGFSMEFNQLSQELDKIGGKISDQSQYIRFIEGVIYIGRTDSLITAEFTNDELRFMYNGHPVATFTSEALKVNSIYIENQLAYFDKWATRKGAYIEGKGYNLTDIWIGG